VIGGSRQGEEKVGDLPERPIYIYKDIRHSSIEITIHRRCIPMWKARWTLNPQQSERGEDLSGTELENALFGLSHPLLDSIYSITLVVHKLVVNPETGREGPLAYGPG
jgi:hypothetical protein